MIVGRRFDGDGDIDAYVKRRQRDVYWQALGIITDTCQRFAELAHDLIGDPSEGWDFIESYDHRTLKQSHDILAAVWRFRYENKVRQMEFPVFRECQQLGCPRRTDQGKMDWDKLWGAWPCPDSDCTWLNDDAQPTFAGHWLKWLRNEVESWGRSPPLRDYLWRTSYPLIRHVLQILKNQNTPAGYEAEDALNRDLLERYSDVPWKRTYK